MSGLYVGLRRGFDMNNQAVDMNPDNIWRQSVDRKLDTIASSLETLIRVEEKQTALMTSFDALTNKVNGHDKDLQDARILRIEMQSVLHSVNATSAELVKLSDSVDKRLDQLEARAGRSDWATKTIERLVAFAAICLAIAANFVDFGK